MGLRSMALPNIMSPYDSLIDFLVEKATPQEILEYKASEIEQARADELTAKNKAGTLTDEEREELRRMAEVETLVHLLKACALVALKQP